MVKESWPRDYIHKEFPKTKDPKDFWGQVSRTVNGQPVTQEQIDLILSAIESGLSFVPDDSVLDIGCGNGALSRSFFPRIGRYLGVDFSNYLIEVAKENFEALPTYRFQEADAIAYVKNESAPETFSKGLCYGVFAYFSPSDAEDLLRNLHDRFLNMQTIFIGNLPDRDRAHLFYSPGTEYGELLDDPHSKIGFWRTQSEFVNLAHRAGWQCEIRNMPRNFYAAHYRFDAVLTRA